MAKAFGCSRPAENSASARAATRAFSAWIIPMPDRRSEGTSAVRMMLLLAAVACYPLAAERRVALIVDTSGSMERNDPPRYAVQISKVLSDLVDDRDQVAIIRFPPGSLLDRILPQNCSAPADPS